MNLKALITSGLVLLPLAAGAQSLSGDGLSGAFTLEEVPRDEGMLTLEELQQLPEGSQRELNDITTETQDKVARGQGAVLRALDRLSGDVTDMELPRGATALYGTIEVTLTECRYPEGNPSGDAYAYVSIRHQNAETPEFSGWMVASSPALNALDDARYDVWPLRCMTS